MCLHHLHLVPKHRHRPRRKPREAVTPQSPFPPAARGRFAHILEWIEAPPRSAAPHLEAPALGLGCRGVPRRACLTCTPAPCRARSRPAENSPLAPGNKVVFSSYPGTLFSCDDFYIMGSGLVSVPPAWHFSPGLWVTQQLWAGGWMQPRPSPSHAGASSAVVLGLLGGGGGFLQADSQSPRGPPSPAASPDSAFGTNSSAVAALGGP